MAKVGLSSPWIIYYRKVEALFKNDPEVKVIYDEERNELSLFVDDDKKADALMKLLPEKMEFGNVVMPINVVPANKAFDSTSIKSNIEDAFLGNDAFSYVQEVEGIYDVPITYVVFAREVVQFWTDNLGDLHGVDSTLYQDIARDVFKPIANVYYCTEVTQYDLLTPLGEWP